MNNWWTVCWPRPVQPYHFKPILMWCPCLFKEVAQTLREAFFPRVRRICHGPPSIDGGQFISHVRPGASQIFYNSNCEGGGREGRRVS
jgi:hypothetical protein